MSGRTKALCTLGAGPHQKLLEIVKPSLAAYAERHGYDLVAERQLLDPWRPASWSKVLLLQRLLESYRAVVWIDCDAVVVDPSRDLLAELPEHAMMGVVAHRTPEGEEIPNLGVMAVRAGPEAREFLRLVWSRTEFIEHVWWENAAALALFGYTTSPPVRLLEPTRWRELTCFLDERWNSLTMYPVPNPRIVHFAGEKHDARLTGLRELTLESPLPVG
jgi:galactosyl transferase GMA12/MNN10 family